LGRALSPVRSHEDQPLPMNRITVADCQQILNRITVLQAGFAVGATYCSKAALLVLTTSGAGMTAVRSAVYSWRLRRSGPPTSLKIQKLPQPVACGRRLGVNGPDHWFLSDGWHGGDRSRCDRRLGYRDGRNL